MNTPGVKTYSNGFKIQQALTTLMGRIGWRQPTVSTFTTTLSDENLQADSLRYFQDFHPYCSPDIIKLIQEDNQITDGNFNAFLQNLQQSVIMESLNAVFGKKELIEQKLLFERFGRADYVSTPNNVNAFVGIVLKPPRDFEKAVQIDQISLYFDQDVTFPLYIFHDAQRTALWTQNVTANAWNQTVVPFDQFVLTSLDGNKSGVFYLGYFQSDLGSANAINEIIQTVNPFYSFGAVPTQMNRRVSDGVTPEIDYTNVGFTSQTHGLNVQFSAFMEHTQKIINNYYLFDELIGLQMACKVIEMIQYSDRSNFKGRVTQEMTSKLIQDLDGTYLENGKPVSTGLRNQIQRETYRVRENLFPKAQITTITSDTTSGPSSPFGINMEAWGITYAWLPWIFLLGLGCLLT